jgi:DNA helicase IV
LRKRGVDVGFFEFFKRRRNVENIKTEVDKTHDSETGLKIGQKLFAQNGELVTVCAIKEKTIIVEYKYKKYERDKAVVGKTLFVSNPLDRNLMQHQAKVEEEKRQEQLKLKQEIERLRLEQLELERKREEERKHQEQLELQKKQEDKKRQERIALQRKHEEERKRLQRKKDAERRIQEKIELEKKQEEERRVQEQLRLKKIKEIELSGGFKKNVTPLYHDIYGEGVFVEFDSTNNYIHVRFNSEAKTTIFSYPDAIGKHLFMQKTDKLLNREEFLKDPKNEKEDLEEQQYFVRVCEVADKNLKSAREEESLMKYGYNDFSDSYDSSIYQKHQIAIKELDLWREIRNNPYFARVDHGENLKFYIGKNAINNLVVDWRDKTCNLYYQYNIYIGNEEHNLSLVRDFEIISGIYRGFIDKYSRKGDYGASNIKDNVISDEFLIKVISANRGDKKTHDIIQTIQRNQYEIITYDALKSMLVLGCAGSGKTMIMLHRLSYMVFNNEDLDIKSIYIISPTRLLNLENDELSRTLKIDLANRLAIGLFNASLIRQYYNQNDIFNSLDLRKIISNSFIDADFIKLVYSDSFIKAFKRDIIAIVSSDSEKREKFIELEDARLLDEYRYFCEDGLVFSNISDAYAKNASLNEIYENVKKAVSKLPLENAIEKLKKFTESLNSSNSNDKTLEGKKEVLENLINHWDLSDKTVYTKKNNRSEVSVSDDIFSEVFGYFNVLGRSNSQNKGILNRFPYLGVRYDTVLQLLNRYKAVAEKINRFERFVNRQSYDYLSEVIRQLIVDIKKNNRIDCKFTYEFEVFLHLVGCNAIFNSLHDKRTLIFVDEFQDYAVTEISLYKQVFPNAVFNLFGDIKQSINPKGLNESEVEQVVENHWKTYSINENYRNAHQITEFINSEFSIDMMPIGIDGSVKHCDISEISSVIQLDDTDRIALIIKNIPLYENIASKYHFGAIEKVNVINDDECDVKRGFLNVIPISLAKGLEFERVYAIPHQMTQNEKYVAYTRALNELCIITMGNIMSNEFIIENNIFLKRSTIGYYHQKYTGFRQPGNPDFLNTLKNTFDSEPHKNLIEARDKVIEILKDDLPQIIKEQSMSNCMLVCVPRAKSIKSFSNSQLMFKEAIKIAANNIPGAIDGTDCIIRVVNTRTTHLGNASGIPNDGDKPYPGITVATCEINKTRIMNQNIILIDDIYTRNVNIDEDCIQALLDNGANKVIFYSIGYTRRI